MPAVSARNTQDPDNQMHHGNEATSTTKGIIEPDSQVKLKFVRFSGGTYSDARVQLIPAEEITYLQHRKPYESRHNMDILETGAPLILHTKFPKKHYQSEACWKGNFHVTGGLIHTCDGLEAHFPLEISIRVYEASNQMPEILNLEAVPLYQLWPKFFKVVPPDSKNIGLWFVSSHQRPHWSFDQLLEKVCSHTGLFTKIGDTELAVFSSKLLTAQDQRKNGKLYFWGVFGKHIRKEPCQPNSHIKHVEISNPSQPNDSCNKYEEVGMKLDVTKSKEKESAKSDVGITLGANRGNPTDVTGNRLTVRDNYEGIAKVLDLTGGEDTDTVNDCMSVLGAPDSNPASSCSVPAASFLNGYCHHDSAKNITSILEDSACQPAGRCLVSPDLLLDIPPGFSLHVPPGLTKAHCQLQIGTAALSYADVPPSLILDIPQGFPTIIPPGFTEAHRRLPPAILPAGAACVLTPRPVKMGAPLGFTPLHAMKKEPGLPAADESETTNKHTLYSLAAAAAAVVKPGKGDEMKIADNEVRAKPYRTSEEREFPKTTMVSDVAGLSSASSWDEIATQRSTPTLRNCTSLGISIPSCLPGKSLTMEVPERQYIRKRGPAHDLSSNITKRSKVNGNTLDSRSKDESKQLTQVSTKPDKSSEEQEFPNASLLSDVPVLSAAYVDDNANQRFDSAPSNYDDLYGSVFAPGKSLNMEAPDTNVHLRKRGQPETSDRSPKITKRPKVNRSNTSESNLKDDSRKLTQVFVHFGDTCISLQVNLETTTVRKLIFSAVNRKGIRSCDAYLLYCGKILEEAYLLSVFSIPKDASFRIIPRLRAGQDQMLITYKSFGVIIKDMKPFYKVVLPVILRKKNETGDVYMVFLSQAARVLVVQLLIYLSYLQSDGWCFNGKFKITNFVFWNGNAMMHPDVPKVKATGSGCQRDMVKLGEEIEKMFKRTNFFPASLGQFPGYVGHLVGLLKQFPIHKWESKTYRLYLNNHPALLSFNERISKYLGMDVQYDFMNANMRNAFSKAVGDFGTWEAHIFQVEPIWDTYWHNPISSTQPRFGSTGVSWLAVGRNFFSHPNEAKRGSYRKSDVPVGFSKEEAEAALALYWKDNLAKFLLNVIENFRAPAGMDIKLLCGNDLVDPDSRGGKSGGTEVGQVQF